MGQTPGDAVDHMKLPAAVAGCPIHTDLRPAGTGTPTAVTLGRFDGVHKGHQALLRATVDAAHEARGARAVAVTLWPPPEWVLRPNDPRGLLTTLPDRLALMARTGVDAIVVLRFDLPLSQQSAGAFLSQLRDELQMSTFMTGPNARIGKGGAGTPEVLRQLGGELAFDYREIRWHGHSQINRSSAIRQVLARGDIAAVNAGLGRYYSLPGVVVRGAGEGRQLGFPTANLSHHSWLQVPGDGVYAGHAAIDGSEMRRAAISIGARPTYGAHARVVEAHLPEYGGDLYWRDLRLFFAARLRDQLVFESTAVLKERIAGDVAAVRHAPAARRDDLAPFIDA